MLAQEFQDLVATLTGWPERLTRTCDRVTRLFQFQCARHMACTSSGGATQVKKRPGKAPVHPHSGSGRRTPARRWPSPCWSSWSAGRATAGSSAHATLSLTAPPSSPGTGPIPLPPSGTPRITHHPRPLLRGYRVHTLLCRGSGLPLLFLLSPAAAHDAPFACPLLTLAVRLYDVRPRIVRLDAGYWGLRWRRASSRASIWRAICCARRATTGSMAASLTSSPGM